jgi:hypothetical protein
VFTVSGDNLLSARSSAIYADVFDQGHWSGWFPWAGGSMLGYLFSSSPATSSWGPGRMELFINGYNQSTGAFALLHTWADNGAWSGSWEVLGTGLMQGHPAAVSWGPGRTDVFVRGGGNELDHKWFDNGHWSSGWEDLGGSLTSSPTVSSGAVCYLNVFVRNQNGGLSQRSFWPSGWGPWWDLDSNTISASPAVVETPGYIHVFARAPGAKTLLYKNWTNQWWSGWRGLLNITDQYGLMSEPAVIVWTPPPPMTQVPNVYLDDLGTAEDLITQAGLVPVYGSSDDNCLADAGYVVRQSPAQSSIVPVGSTVTLRVSSGYDRFGNLCFPNA